MATALPWLPAGAQTSQKITAGKASEYGLVYSLPVTALDIYLVAELEEAHPGEFQNYARRHLAPPTPLPPTAGAHALPTWW